MTPQRSMQIAEIKAELRRYVLAEFLAREPQTKLDDDTPLRTGGILDSVGTLKLVAFIEEQFGVELLAHETGIESFDRIEDVAALVASKQAGRAGG